ncbi:hypothetical protein SDC9_184043 [bioreactor metagenome]|uniref:Uncharacterized protein n=1 Tax=bioreactor metagenome TaxID=1076179 RepID=A0A645HK74_9ZZZZ
MLVDDDAVDQPQPGCHFQGAFPGRLIVLALHDHGGTHHGGPGAGAHHDAPRKIEPP